MKTLARPRTHHVALTVTDIDASQRWYENVFGVHFVVDVPHLGGLGRVLADDAKDLMIVLHRHDTNDRNLFAETATGLDHVGFVVPARADLEAWQVHLEANGVSRSSVADKPLTQSPIADEPYGSVLVFATPTTSSWSSSPRRERENRLRGADHGSPVHQRHGCTRGVRTSP